MANQPNNFDFRALLEELAGFARNRAGAFTAKAGVFKPEAKNLSVAVMAAVSSEAKNVKQITEAIALSNGGAWSPTLGEVRTALEKLIDEGFVAAETKKDRKVYSLTKAGQTELTTARKNLASDIPAGESMSATITSWLSFDPSFLSTASKLGPVLLDLAQTGTKAQQEKATKVLEETRHQLHKILADN